jgi:hypothetical protein
MRELTIPIDADMEIGLRVFMERTRTTDETEAARLALRAATLITEPAWLGSVIQGAVRDLPGA